jgi:hypothetical protein
MDTLTLPRTCKRHGEHEDWSVRKPHGAHKTPYLRCRPCDRERQQAIKQERWRVEARHRARAKERAAKRGGRDAYRDAAYIALLEQYGAGVAERYRGVCDKNPDRRIDVRAVLKAMIAEALPHLSPNQVQRLLKFNDITKNALTNTTWICAHCSIESSDTGFFDIDHIVPCATLRKRSYRDNSNLQLLCPNCHRCKTGGLAPWFEMSESVAA